MVFGLFTRGGRVYAAIVPNAKTASPMPIIKGKVTPDSVVYADTLKSYNALDVSAFRHRRINHSELFAEGGKHINGIENLWNQAERHLRRFNGIKPEDFELFLKECEWRFNGGNHRQLPARLGQWYKRSKH